MRCRHRLLVPLLCLILGASAALGQTGATVDITRDDQLRLVAPSHSGQTGLFETLTADTLRRGDLSFSIYYQNWDLTAGPAPVSIRPLSARPYNDMGYDLYRLSASLGWGVTDRWELSAMVPWDRVKGNGGDRIGFVNGWLYQGKFNDSGIGQVRLATKFGFSPSDAPSRVSMNAFADLSTGDDDSGVATGSGAFGLGFQWTRGIGTIDAQYKIAGNRRSGATNFGTDSIEIPNEFNLNGGLNIPLSWWRTTNWVSEVNARFYNGGEFAPPAPIFLTTGFRHWFGNSGWALSAGARWNVAKFRDDNDECRFTELDDCGLGALAGLTFAPLHLTPLPPPPPPPVIPPPAPAPTPVAPPEPPPVAPPRQPTELRSDEIHFEAGSARLTNIAKAILDDVALRMKQEPTSTAIVIGYTDNRENTGANADLDRRRAQAVRDYLVSRHGIDASRITVEGRGSGDPVGDNTTPEGRLRNRRVVIRLILP